jgi:hypothetical protein
MSVSEEIGSFIAKIILTLKSESVEWKQANQAKLLKLEDEKAFSEKKREHQLVEMEIKFKGYCDRLQEQEEYSTQEFRDFLDSIDETKSKMLEYYPKTAKPIVLMIHHRAAELLREAWHNPDAREALKKHDRFIELMLTVTQDLSELESGSTRKLLPDRTIKFVRDLSQ